MQAQYPLSSHAPDDILAYRHGQGVAAGRFFQDALSLASTLVPGGHVINVCHDRYLFAVGLAAGLLAGKVTLMPPSFAPQQVHDVNAANVGRNIEEDLPDQPLWGQLKIKVIAIVVAVLLSIFAGVLLGLVSGYFGGWVDRVLVMIADAVYSFPSLLLAILMAIMISHGQSGLWSGIFASGISITVVYIPQYFRTIRAEVIRIKESAYVESARVVGASTWRIMTKHLFKNSTRTLPVILTLNSSEAILTLAGLGFLGFGIEPTAAAEWGYDLNRAVSDVTAGIWWTAVFPGLAIVLIVLGITLVGESLNDLADPRLRARKSAGEVVGSIEDTSVDPSQEPGKRNEVVAELEAAKNPMGASDKPVTVTDRDPSFVASEWASEEGE